MQSFPQSVFPELDTLGGFRALKGTLDETSFEAAGLTYGLPEGIAYDITLTNTGEGILVQGSASAVLNTECARCLDPVSLEVTGEVQGYYLLDPEELDQGYEPDEVDVVADDGSFDLAGPIQAAVAYATPFVILCKEDCLGLCPKCGANLNEGECDCKDDIDPLNPFAALMGMQFSAEDTARGEAAAAEHADDEPAAVADDEPELSPEDEAALEAALDAFFNDEDAQGSLEFDDEGNLFFVQGPAEEDEQ